MALKDRVKKLEENRRGEGHVVVIHGRRQDESAQEYEARVARCEAEASNGALVVKVMKFGFENAPQEVA